MSDSSDVVALITINAKDNASKTIDGVSSKWGGFAKSVVAAAAVVVGSTVAIGAYTVDLASKYQTSTVQMQNNAQMTAAAAKQIADAFLATGGTATFSAQEQMDAFGPVAGQLKLTEGHALSLSETTMLMKASMDLADATGQSLTSTTSDLSKVMQAFSLPVKDAASITDVLFNASTATGVSLDAFTTSITRAKSSMGAAAPSFQELSGLVVDLTKHGETGRQAIGALGSMFTSIITPTKAVAAEQKKLGLEFLTSKGNLQPLDVIFKELAPHIKGMGDAAGVALLKSVGFGGASQKMFETIQSGGAVLDAYIKDVTKTGTAAQGAANYANTWAGTMKTMNAFLQDLGVKIGQMLMPYLMQFGKWFQEHEAQIKAFAMNALQFVLTAIQNIAKWVGSILPTLEQFGAIVLSVGETIAGVVITVGQWLQKMGLLLPILVTIVAVMAIFKTAMMIKDLIFGVGAAIQLFQAGLGGLAVSEEAATTTSYSLGTAIAFMTSPIMIWVAAVVAVIAIVVLLITHWNQVKQVVGEVAGAVVGFVSGMANAVGGAFARMGQIVTGIWNGITGAIKGAINGIIDAINFFIRMIDAVQVHIHVLGINVDWNGLGIGTIPKMHSGGMVPGPVGSDQLIMAQAGETVSAAHQPGFGGSGNTLNLTLQLPGAIIADESSLSTFTDRVSVELKRDLVSAGFVPAF